MRRDPGDRHHRGLPRHRITADTAEDGGATSAHEEGGAHAQGHRLPEDPAAAERAARFGHLPDRVLPEQMVEENPAEAPSDPSFGRDPDRDWMIRYSA